MAVLMYWLVLDKTKIVNAYNNFNSYTKNYDVDLYGNGKASERILEILLSI